MAENEDEKYSPQGDNEESNCPECGENVSRGMKFCPNCGATLIPGVSAPAGRIREKPRFDFPGLVSIGIFLVLLGTIYLGTAGLTDALVSFIGDFRLVEISEQPRFMLPAPASHHPAVYGAVETFCLVFGASQVFVLVLRLVLQSPLSKKTETASGLIFWLGVGYIAGLLKTETISWFNFWAGVIIFAGLSLVVRSLLGLALSEKV